MSILAKILGTYAAGHAIDHGGVSFTFGRIDHAKAAELEAAYFKRCRESVYATRGEVSEDVYERMLSRVSERYAAGDYAFPVGESYNYYLRAGLTELAAMLTGRPRAECQALVAERCADVMHVILCVVAESFPDFKKKMLQMEADRQPQMLAQIEQLARTLAVQP